MATELATILSTPKKLHFIGVGGSGMYPLVQILLADGHFISGSDTNEGDILNYERKQGVRVLMGHDAQNVHGADLVVYSAAIPASNPERIEAERLGIPTIERSIMLGYVTSLYQNSVCIAGTHGKTTATGMTTQILEMAGLDPAAVIGGKLPYINGYGKSGKNDIIVVESCEYHNTFLELRPGTAVLLNVDDDHLEFFGSMEGLKAAFHQFCALATKSVIYNGDDEDCEEVVQNLNVPVYSFGIKNNCYYRALNPYEYKPSFWAFTVVVAGIPHGEIKLAAPGYHNIYNALAAYAGAMGVGASYKQCANGLAAFGGTGRRFEVQGEVQGFTVVDDYAHHPTELRAALTTAKGMGYNKVWAVFQPYTYSRTQMLLDEFAEVLPIADQVVMTAIMGGRELAADYDITTQALADKIPGSIWFETQREVADYILANAKAGDLVITLGCGDIYKCAHMLMDAK